MSIENIYKMKETVLKNIKSEFLGIIELYNKINEEKFWEIVKTGFAHKRKKLSGNLKSLKNYKENAFIKSLENKRAEDLALSDWIKLTLSTDL